MDCYLIPFRGERQVTPAEAWRMMLKASLKHQKKCSEINEKMAAAATEMMDGLMLSSPQARVM